MKNNIVVKETLSGVKYCVATSDNCGQLPEFFERNRSISGVSVSNHNGYHENNLSFLSDIPGLEWLAVNDEYEDISSLRALSGLTYLQLSTSQKIDFSCFPLLIEYRGLWPKDCSSLNECLSLNALSLRKGKKDQFPNDFSQLSLVELELYQCQFDSLAGLNFQDRLQRLVVGYCPKLTDVSNMSNISSLIDVSFDRCKRIDNLSAVSFSNFLKSLSLNYCGTLNDIEFIGKLSDLESLAFFGTQILSNDLMPIERCEKISALGFNDRKGHSKTLGELRVFHGLPAKINY